MTTKESLRRFIIEELSFSGDPAALDDDDYPLLDNQVIDSLGVFQLVSFLEDEFGIEVDDEELVPDNFATIGRIVALVERSQGT
jgi:acyl carrier protein